MDHFCSHPYGALLSIWQDVTLGETHQDSSLGSAYKVTAVGTNQAEHLECKHAACRRGCSALVFPSPFTVPEVFTRSTTTSAWYTACPSTVASWLRQLLLRAFRGRALRVSKVQHSNFPSAISKHSLALLFPKPEPVFAALSLIALTDLSAWNVSHCFVNQLYFCYSQCLAALCVSQSTCVKRISFC